jgi:NADH-quinone oxidoreductase subunit N
MSSYLINENISIVYIIIFIFIYIIRFQLVINRDDWFLLWLGLEVNIITFIIFIYKLNSILSIESCLKYFFIQRIGSAILIRLFYLKKDWLDLCLLLVLSYKIGAGPFFFWFPSVCSGISWFSFFILISFQKIIPLILIRFLISKILYIIVIISLLFGVFGSFNQKNLKLLIAYSSVYHLGWILLCINTNDLYWGLYLIVYILVVFPIVIFMQYYNVEDILNIMKVKYSYYLIFLILRISGIPPFLGFFLKWFAFIIIFNYDLFFIIFIIICSVVIFYIYFRLVYDRLLIYNEINIWRNLIIFKNKNYLIILTLIGLSVRLFFIFLILY